MERTLIQYQIDEIRKKLEAFLASESPLVDTHIAIMMLQTLKKLTEDGGFPTFDIPDVKFTDRVESAHLNAIQEQIMTVITTARDVMTEQSDQFNDVLAEFSRNINESNELIESAKSSIDNLEKQVKERVTNTSVHTHELKEINFNFNYDIKDVNIINNTIITLPVVSSRKISGTPSVSVIHPSSAMITSLANLEGDKDVNLFRGSFIGRLIAQLDEIKWGDDYGLHNAFDNASNTDFVVQTIGWTQPSRIDINYTFAQLSNSNLITIDTNGDAHVDFLGGKDVTTATPKNGVVIGSMNATGLKFRITNDAVSYPSYDVIRLKDQTTKEIASVLNFAETLEAMNMAEKIFGPDQIRADVGDYDIELTSKDMIPVVETIIDNITISEATYGSVGIWKSKAITTEQPIISIEINADVSIPDSDKELVKFSLSFDNEKFYQMRNATGSVDTFNINYPVRIVLNTDELVDDYLYIPMSEKQDKVYLKIEFDSANTNKDTPVIYSLILKIKTEQVTA